MKKLTTILKTMFLATIVLVMAQSCIPTTPTGGNPTPTPSTDSNVYYRFSNSVLLRSNQNSIYNNSLDLNLNNINDVSFSLEATYGREGMNITSEDNTLILSPVSEAQAFTSGTPINNMSFTIPGLYLCDCGSNGVYPYSNSKLWYVGFNTTLNGNTHYGWLQLKYNVNIQPVLGGTMSMPIPNVTCTLIDYAFHKIPDTPIAAGYH